MQFAQTTGKGNFNFYNTGVGWKDATSVGALSTGKWYFFLGTWQAGNYIYLYIKSSDSSEVATSSATISGTIAYDALSKLTIGRGYGDTARSTDGKQALHIVQSVFTSASQATNIFNQERHLFGV